MNLIDKLEVGKMYKTNGGRELEFLCLSTNAIFPIIMIWREDVGCFNEVPLIYTFTEDGRCQLGVPLSAPDNIDLSQFEEKPKYYSETLKKLIEQKVDLKFRVTPEWSKKLQEFLFTLNVPWGRWSDGKEFTVQFVDENFLWASSKRYCITSESSDEEWFFSTPDQEFDLEKDCLVEKPKEKIDLRKVLKIGGVYNTRTEHYICLIGICDNEIIPYPYLFYHCADNRAEWHGKNGDCSDNYWSLDLTQFEDKK